MTFIRCIVLLTLAAALVMACGAPGAVPGGGSADRSPTAPGEAGGTAASTTRSSGIGSTPTSAASGELVVFAAASLTDAFTELGERLERTNSGLSVRFNFAGSQDLAAAIRGGAPADVFASASGKQMEAVIEAGDVAAGSEREFVRNRLVAITPKENEARVVGLRDLARPGLRLVLAAEQVPVGEYTRDFLDAASRVPTYGPAFRNGVIENVVSYQDNVRSVLRAVALGEADAGIVYTSDAASAEDGEVREIEIPDELNQIATYPIAPTASAGNPSAASRFIAFVLSPDGQDVLRRHGFVPLRAR